MTLLVGTFPANSIETLPQEREVQLEMDANVPYEFLLQGEGQQFGNKYGFLTTFKINNNSKRGMFFAYGIFDEGRRPWSNLTEFLPEKINYVQPLAVPYDKFGNRINTSLGYGDFNESATLAEIDNQSKTFDMIVLTFEINSTTSEYANSPTDDINIARLILYSTIDVEVTIHYVQMLLGMNDEKTPIGYFGLSALLAIPLIRKGISKAPR